MSLLGEQSWCHFNIEKSTAVKVLARNTLLPNELTNWLIFLFHVSLCKCDEMTMPCSPDPIKSSHVVTVVLLCPHI